MIRKFTLVVLCTWALVSAMAQAPLFKIISFTDGVTIDGALPTAGMNVHSDKIQITIGANSYLWVITDQGILGKVSQSIKVANVNKLLNPKRKNKLTGSAGVAIPAHVRLLTSAAVPRAYLSGDSVFVAWQINFVPRASILYEVRTSDAFGEYLSKVTTSDTWTALKIETKDQPKLLLLTIDGGADHLKTDVIVHFPDQENQKILNQALLAIPKEARDELFYRLAVFNSLAFSYDAWFTLYQIIRRGATTEDPFLSAYAKRLILESGIDKLTIPSR